MVQEQNILASESCHWYDKQGAAVYEVPRVKGGGMRPTTLADARKLGLVPSVTTILSCAAKPGLEAWKAKQILEAALTLPRLPDETLDDYATRIIEDSKAQGKKAAIRGTELHAAIEAYIRGDQPSLIWIKHCIKVQETLKQYGIDIFKGKTEHSFASSLGFGGKIDWNNDEVLIDFKTKANLEPKRLAYDEHCWQLAAYAHGIHHCDPSAKTYSPNTRLINVFIGVDDQKVVIVEWNRQDNERGWRAFQCLLTLWQITKNYTP